jgi:hypothetical protein
VILLDARKKIADLDLPGMPHLGSGITWKWQDPSGHERTRDGHAQPQRGSGDGHRSRDLPKHQTDSDARPGLLPAQPRKQRYAFTDSMMSKEHKHTLQVIDKQTLEVVAADQGQARTDAGACRIHP